MNRLLFVFLITALVSSLSQATTVRMTTTKGDIDIVLFDNTTPDTVANFLAYINEEKYENLVFHRSIDDFMIQAGLFTLVQNEDMEFVLTGIETKDTIANEPVYSNVRGTIAMAKKSNYPNSASSQFFFNTADNNGELEDSANLDTQNGGFTVFGKVTEESLAVLDALNAVETFTLAEYADFPVDNYNDEIGITADNYLTVSSITITDTNPHQEDDLTKVENTAIKTEVGLFIENNLVPEVDTNGNPTVLRLFLEINHKAETDMVFPVTYTGSATTDDIVEVTSVTLPANETLLQFDITLVDDGVEEQDEIIEITIGAGDNENVDVSKAYTAARIVGDMTQNNDDGGGSLHFFGLLLAGLVIARRRFKA